MHTEASVVLEPVPRRVRRWMLAILAALAATHLVLVAIPGARGDERTFLGLAHVFDMGAEANIPNSWSALLLLVAAALMLTIAQDVRLAGNGIPGTG